MKRVGETGGGNEKEGVEGSDRRRGKSMMIMRKRRKRRRKRRVREGVGCVVRLSKGMLSPRLISGETASMMNTAPLIKYT